LINSKKLIIFKIISRIFAGNRCYYSLRQIFRSRAMSKVTPTTGRKGPSVFRVG
jgi:hypothetical protein